MIGSFLLDFGKKKKLSNEHVLDFPALQNINNYLFLTKLFSPCDTMAHFLLLRACSHLFLLTSLRDFWFAVSRFKLIKEVLWKGFTLHILIFLVSYNPHRLPAITCAKCGLFVCLFVFFKTTIKLAMKWKQGTRLRGQETGKKGVYKGRKQWRVLFICHKERLKIWVRLGKSSKL